jgi:putative copper resistance protein D
LVALLLSPLRANLALRLILSGLLLATLAPVGHGAMLDGTAGHLLILNQLIHLMCVGAWLGGLMLLLMILRAPAGHSMRTLLLRFSGIGYGLVAGLLITGLINVRVLTGAFWPTPLFSGFALILLIKAALVAAMLGLALFNRLRIDDCEQRLATLRSSVMLEWLLGIGAVAAVSLLGTLPPMISS